MRFLPILLISILVNAFGNTLLSRAMKEIHDPILAAFHAGQYGAAVLVVLLNPTFWIAVGLLLAFFLLFLTMLSKADLSYVLPLTAINYVITVFLAAWFLGEHVTVTRWIAVTFISMGVLMVSVGESSTVEAQELSIPAEEQA